MFWKKGSASHVDFEKYSVLCRIKHFLNCGNYGAGTMGTILRIGAMGTMRRHCGAGGGHQHRVEGQSRHVLDTHCRTRLRAYMRHVRMYRPDT